MQFVGFARSTTLCLKKCPTLDLLHDPITIIYGRNVTKKVENQMILCFPTSPI